MNNEYILAFNQLLKECDTLYHTMAVKAGLSDCAFWILYTLYNTDQEFTQSEICNNGFMPKQTVNTALKKLEKDNYLVLVKKEDKVKKYIQLTDTGICFIEKNIVPIMKAENNAVSNFSDEQKDIFLKTLKTFVYHLKHEFNQVELEEQ